MAEKIPTIHRDGSFEFKGVRYRVSQGSDTPTRDGSRFVYREDENFTLMADGFGYMYEVREWLARAVREDWPDLDELRVHEHVEYSGPARHHG